LVNSDLEQAGLNKTWNKPFTTPNEKQMTTINYFRVVDFIHPRSRKSTKVPSNWLPCRILCDYECFLCAAGLCSAIPRGNLIIAYIPRHIFPHTWPTHFVLMRVGEAIDILLAMNTTTEKVFRGI